MRQLDGHVGLNTDRSRLLYERACKVVPGGVGSHAQTGQPGAFDPYPLYMESGQGSAIWDVDGNKYIDYACALGPLIHGHSSPRIIENVVRVLKKGPWQNPPTELVAKVGEDVTKATGTDMVRFTNSGTEATMYAIRVARAFTGRDKVLMFQGAYHGGHDYALCTHPPLRRSSANKSLLTNPQLLGLHPDSWGVPQKVLETVMVVPWNDIAILETTIENHADELACVLTEPVQMNIGCAPPRKGYLESMRRLTEENDTLLIFDEVITGFRLALGGAQEYFNIKADLATYAKALSGGFPIGAIAGKSEIMKWFSPNKVAHYGTMNANPACLAAIEVSLEMLSENNGAALKNLHKRGDRLIEGIEKAIDSTKTEAIVQGMRGAGLQIFFTPLKKIDNYQDFQTCDRTKYKLFQKELLKRGIYVHPAQSEHIFLSTAHTDEDIETAVLAVNEALSVLPKNTQTSILFNAQFTAGQLRLQPRSDSLHADSPEGEPHWYG